MNTVSCPTCGTTCETGRSKRGWDGDPERWYEPVKETPVDQLLTAMRLDEDGNMALTLDEYQGLAMRTASNEWPTTEELVRNRPLLLVALGLAGEGGEVADNVKKWLNHGHPIDYDKIDKEVGDILWYCARYAQMRGLSLNRLARINVEKLRARYPQGFTSERSLHREGENG
jgi:NTP pyrophosphatase (non-canonical NTP hydrolase)